MRLILCTLTLAACLGVLRASLAADRGLAFSGGGGDTDPPLSGPAGAPHQPGSAPSLRPGPVIVLLTASSERPRGPEAPRFAVVRRGSRIVDFARLVPGEPAVLDTPAADDLRLDVIGTGAVGVPVAVGQVVRVVVP